MTYKMFKMKMMGKILLIIFLLGIFLFSLPNLTQGTTICPPCPEEIRGWGVRLIPCGHPCYIEDPRECDPCQPCHFFVMLNNIIRFVMFTLVPIVAVLMLVIGGVMFFFAGAKPEVLTQAKNVITSVVIGLLIIFSAWIIVNTILTGLGIVEFPHLLRWYQIYCPT